MSANQAEIILLVIGVISIAIALIILKRERRKEVVYRLDRLENSIMDQLDLSRRTMDASSRMMREALRLANQKQGVSDVHEENDGEYEDCPSSLFPRALFELSPDSGDNSEAGCLWTRNRMR